MGARSHHVDPHGAIALLLSGAGVIVLAICFVVSRSPLVAANVAHAVIDLGGLAVGESALLIAHRRPATRRLTFGLGRLDPLAGLVLSLGLIALNVWIVVAAIGQRVASHALPAISLAAAVVGLNALTVLVLLARADRTSLARRSNIQHAAGDVGTFLVTIAALVLWQTVGWSWALPMATIIIAVLVTIAALSVAHHALSILLEAAPANVAIRHVEDAIRGVDHVQAVHHVHLWQLDAHSTALSAHVLLDGPHTVHETQFVVQQIKVELAQRFGIDHATLEAECHACSAPTHGGG